MPEWFQTLNGYFRGLKETFILTTGEIYIILAGGWRAEGLESWKVSVAGGLGMRDRVPEHLRPQRRNTDTRRAYPGFSTKYKCSSE